MKTKIVHIACMAIFLSGSLKIKAQTWIENIDKYPDLKAKGVYIVMNDTTAAANKAYWHIYQTYWTYSKVNFLPYADMDNYLHAGNYFFTIIRAQTEQDEQKTGYWRACYSCSLQLWEYKGKSRADSLKKEELLNGKLNRHISCLAGIDLFSSEKTAFYSGNYLKSDDAHIPKLDFYTNYDYSGTGQDGKRIYFNWSEGLLKNYLQGIMWYAGQKKKLTSSYVDLYEKDQMEALKHDTLFVPDFAFVQYGSSPKIEVPVLLEKKRNPKTAATEEKLYAGSIFRKYKYPYKLITSEELSIKLLNDPKPFHYLLYVLNNADKQITIVNSENGENIYFTGLPKEKLCSPMPCAHMFEVKLHPKDLDNLVNKMKEK